MACPQIENKLVGAKFLVHGVANHVLLKQRGLSLVKPKLALGAFYSHTLAWLPRVIERKGLCMRLNPHVFFMGPK
jgi:hypothetical protein